MNKSIFLCALLLTSAPSLAIAGSFDLQGNYGFDSTAVFNQGFENTPSWNEGDPDAGIPPEPGAIKDVTIVEATDALEGGHYAYLDPTDYWEGVSVPVELPPVAGSYRARLWIRSGSVMPVFVATYQSKASRQVLADLSPTGRCTSDGWVEMLSSPFSVDGQDVATALINMRGAGHVDAVEVIADGMFQPDVACFGAFDPVCGDNAPCIDGYCRPGDTLVPLLPPAADRERIVDLFRTRVQYFFGGYETRRLYLPAALEHLDRMRTATTPWRFWHSFAVAVRKLHDWHTSASGLIDGIVSSRRLNVCFIEGDADLSHAQWPPDPRYLDVLVSHTGKDRTAGLRSGDRLVAVDGLHPIAWARSLIDVSWDWWQANDDSVNAELVETLRSRIPKYARTLTVIRCDSSSDTCSGTPEVIDVATLPVQTDEDGPTVRCDNRPAYHLVDGPDPDTHDVGYDVYVGPLVDSEPGEKLYGMTWDTLWGAVHTPTFKAANDEFRANARGVILDHRAGNGGTIDAPEAITELVRSRFDIAIFIFDRPSADYEGPATKEEGLAIFNRYKVYSDDYPDLTYTVGSADPAIDLPVALLLHRDGSASDYLPFGMKGAPKVRIFGPQPTAGAFSSFVNMSFGSTFSVQMASGDTISFEGSALIGHGAEPDEIVLPLQSDLLHGRDTIYLRALDWVRSEIEP